jgi:hypothetical protein
MSGSENPVQDARGAASLTASLLARRGGARPAMRRQPLGSLHAALPINDDLGWNDMGDEDSVDSAVIAVPDIVAVETPVIEEVATVRPPSPINLQLKALAERLSLRPEARPKRASKQPATLTGGRKAAFTLRLDPERRLRLRLLSAVSNCSAQQLLVEALDSLIAGNDQVQDLAEQVEDGRTAKLKWG